MIFFLISLTSVSIAGSAASNRGPTINHLKSSSIVTILANNDPYGVVSWKNRFEITTEEKEVNSSAVLILSRAFGALGDIMVAYETQQAVNVSRNERKATPGVDYFTQKSTVLIRQGVKEAIVYIKVRHVSNVGYFGLNNCMYIRIDAVHSYICLSLLNTNRCPSLIIPNLSFSQPLKLIMLGINFSLQSALFNQ